MSENKTRVTLYVPDEVAQQFEKTIIRRYGKLDGNRPRAGELALREWCDNDRLQRVERKLDRVLEGEGGTPSESISETETESQERPQSEVTNTPSVTGPVGERLDAIVSDLPTEREVHKSDIRELIERHAGVSETTFKKYLQLLVRHNHIVPHPREDSYFTGPGSLALCIEKDDRVDPFEAYHEATDKWEAFGNPGQDTPEEWWFEKLDEMAGGFAESQVLKIDRHPRTDTDRCREERYGTTLDELKEEGGMEA